MTSMLIPSFSSRFNVTSKVVEQICATKIEYLSTRVPTNLNLPNSRACLGYFRRFSDHFTDFYYFVSVSYMYHIDKQINVVVMFVAVLFSVS